MKEYFVILLIIVLFLLFFCSMSALHDLGSRLGEVLLVLHVSLDFSDCLLISWNLHLLVKVHLLSGLLPLEVENAGFLEVYLGFDTEP